MGFSAWSMGLSDTVLLLDGPPGEASAASSNLWVSMGSGIHGGEEAGLGSGGWSIYSGRGKTALCLAGVWRKAKSRGPGAGSPLPARPEK